MARRKYDADGFDYDGYNRDGYDQDGFDRDGYDIGGFDSNGVHRNGTRYDENGLDRYGCNKEGFAMFLDGSLDDVNMFGFMKNGIHTKTGTNLDPKGYNFYGLKDGYNKKGELDPDVALAQEFIDRKAITVGRFAKEKKIDKKELAETLDFAGKKMPILVEDIKLTRRRGVKKLYAIIRKDCEGVKTVSDLEKFWHRHRKLSIMDLMKICSDDIRIIENFIAIAHGQIGYDDKIVLIIRSFSQSFYDLKGAMHNIELIVKKIEDNRVRLKLYELDKYLAKFNGSLRPCKISFDNGETWIELTKEKISSATQQLKSEGIYVCQKTLKSYFLELSRSGVDA